MLLPQQTHPWIVAHRGVSDQCPENSRAAFQAAIDQQADAIECDLQFTADQHIVICHDATFERYGHPDVRVADASLPQLQSLDLGTWFHPDFAAERLLTLEELLNEFGQQIPFLLEIKNTEPSAAETQNFLNDLVQQLTIHRQQTSVAVLCFDSKILQQLREIAPWLTLVLNTHQPQQLQPNDVQQQPWLNAVDGNIDRLTAQSVAMFRQHQLSAWCFTCNTQEDVLKARDLHLDAIITNDPARTRQILHQHRPLIHET